MIAEYEQLNPHRWVESHADYLYAYTISRINDEEKADKFEGKSSERTWLTAILRNKIVDVYRKKSSGLVTTDIHQAEQEQADFFNTDDGHWSAERAPRSFGLDDHDPVVHKEFNQILQQCMQKLPALWMSVFTMKHLDDETTDIICAELKLTAANFWVIIHRTKLNLRACLQKNWI